MITAVQLVKGDGTASAIRKQRDAAEAELTNELERLKLDAFPLVVAAPDLRIGATTLLQSWGIGPVRSNTVLLNWMDSQEPGASPTLSLWYARLLPHAARLDQHVAVLDASDADWTALEQRSPDNRRIDVWWFDDDSSRLALLLAYLMTRSELLDEATLRVLAPASADTAQKVRTNLTHRLEEFRIDAAIDVVANDGGEVSTYARSQDAAFVLLPLRLDGMHMLDPTGGAVANLLDMPPVVAMVAACGDVKLMAEEDSQAQAAANRHADTTPDAPPLAPDEPSTS